MNLTCRACLGFFKPVFNGSIFQGGGARFCTRKAVTNGYCTQHFRKLCHPKTATITVTSRT